jgi:hypothetical protein
VTSEAAGSSGRGGDFENEGRDSNSKKIKTDDGTRKVNEACKHEIVICRQRKNEQ